jgi:hypothetical protein
MTKHNGIGSLLTEAPSHTTGHTGPYPAVRLIKAEQELSTDNPNGFQASVHLNAMISHLTQLVAVFMLTHSWIISKRRSYSVGALDKRSPQTFHHPAHDVREMQIP